MRLLRTCERACYRGLHSECLILLMHSLASFGGAGGQHACEIASLLGIKTVLIHRYSSILSAYGLALADRYVAVLLNPRAHTKNYPLFAALLAFVRSRNPRQLFTLQRTSQRSLRGWTHSLKQRRRSWRSRGFQ